MNVYDLNKKFDDLFQHNILKCNKCDFTNKKSEEYHFLSKWNMPAQWAFWAKNKFPCSKNAYYTLYKFRPIREVPHKIVFVALRPSLKQIPNIGNIAFGDALIENKLVREKFEMEGDTFIFYETDVLITDLINCRGLAKEDIDETHLIACIDHLLEQLNIVKDYVDPEGEPPMIIAIGSDTKRKLMIKSMKKRLDEMGIKLIGKVRHYGRQSNPNDYMLKFNNDYQNIQY